jgi:hypothetical protein
MKIIFLDIDGVLNVIPQGFDKYGGIFHDHFVKNFKHKDCIDIDFTKICSNHVISILNKC